jgi:hypothetical protein
MFDWLTQFVNTYVVDFALDLLLAVQSPTLRLPSRCNRPTALFQYFRNIHTPFAKHERKMKFPPCAARRILLT